MRSQRSFTQLLQALSMWLVLLLLAAVLFPTRATAQRPRWITIDTVREASADGRTVATTRLEMRSTSAKPRAALRAGKGSVAAASQTIMRATYTPANQSDSVVIEGVLTMDCTRGTAKVSQVNIVHAPAGITAASNADTVTVDPQLVRRACGGQGSVNR